MRTELEVTVNGQQYPVEIEGDGTFRVNLGVEDGSSNIIKAASFPDLERKARKVKVAFELPFSRLGNNGKVKHGTVTGIHATNGNVLVRWEPEIIAGRPAAPKTEQLASWSSHGDVTRRLNDAETAEVERLLAARRKAQRELDDYMAPLKLASLKKAAEQARDNAAKETK